MTNVHLITEDRTGGGLEALLKAEAQSRRAQQGRPPLHFARKSGSVNGNAALLSQCGKYENFRFNYAPRMDHVFYVIDARNAWDLPPLGGQTPQPPYEHSLPPFIQTIREKMALLARAPSWTAQEWEELRAGFHAHVLVWERESLILPVADKLGLGEAVTDVYAERRAAEAVDERFRRIRKNLKYQKPVQGLQYLQRIAQDLVLREAVVASNASLRAIIDDLVSL